MSGSTSSVEGFHADFLTPILPNIGGELTREGLIEIHSIDKCECGVRGVEPQRRTTWTLCADDYGQGLRGIDSIRVCAATQSRRLPTDHGERPRTSARI